MSLEVYKMEVIYIPTMQTHVSPDKSFNYSLTLYSGYNKKKVYCTKIGL